MCRKKRDGRSIIASQNCNEIVGNNKNELKIIILVLNYLIALVYTKTIIVASGGIYLAASPFRKLPPQLATSNSVNNCYKTTFPNNNNNTHNKAGEIVTKKGLLKYVKFSHFSIFHCASTCVARLEEFGAFSNILHW